MTKGWLKDYEYSLGPRLPTQDHLRGMAIENELGGMLDVLQSSVGPEILRRSQARFSHKSLRDSQSMQGLAVSANSLSEVPGAIKVEVI